MDEWVGEDRFLSTEEAPDLDESESSSAANQGPMTRNQRRKINDDHGIPVHHKTEYVLSNPPPLIELYGPGCTAV